MVPCERESEKLCKPLPLRSTGLLRVFQHSGRCDRARKGNQRLAPREEERSGADAEPFVERFEARDSRHAIKRGHPEAGAARRGTSRALNRFRESGRRLRQGDEPSSLAYPNCNWAVPRRAAPASG